MDQINDSKYPSPAASKCSLSATLFIVGTLLLMGAPLNYAMIGNAEQAVIIIAYAFFFFLGSGLLSVCSSEDS